MYTDDCGCKKNTDFQPRRVEEKNCDCCCTSGLKEQLHRCQWVVIFTKDGEFPLLGHVRKVTCDVVVLDNVFVPGLPFLDEAVVSLCEITKFLKFDEEVFGRQKVMEAMTKMAK